MMVTSAFRRILFIASIITSTIIIPDSRASNNRAENLYSQIKCPVCDGQTIADSGATLAQDMRETIDRMVIDGQDDQAIKEFFRERYGDEVLLDPNMNSSTIWLWVLPIAFAIAGAISLLRRIYNKKNYLSPA